MEPVTMGLIGSGLIAGLSAYGGYQAQVASRRESQRNRLFQERMRNTAWQAAVADMSAAGINPAVAYSKGPAASPGGSTASQNDFVTPAVSSAMQAKRMQAELDMMKSQEFAARSQGNKASAEAQYQYELNKLWGTTLQDPTGPGRKFVPGPLYEKFVAEASSAKAIAMLNQLQIPNLKNMANMAGTDAGKMLAWLKYILEAGKIR